MLWEKGLFVKRGRFARKRSLNIPILFLVFLQPLMGCDRGEEAGQGPRPGEPSVQITVHEDTGTFDLCWTAFPDIRILGATSRFFRDTGWVSPADYPGGCTARVRNDAKGEASAVLECPGEGALPDLTIEVKPEQASGAFVLAVRLLNNTGQTFWIHGLEPLCCKDEMGGSLWLGRDPEEATVLINGQASWAYSGQVRVRRGSLYKGITQKVLEDKELLSIGNNVLDWAQIVAILLNGWDECQAGVSWWNMAVHGPGSTGSLAAGALDAERWKTAFLLEYDPEEQDPAKTDPAAEGQSFTQFRAVCGLTGDRISLDPGQAVSSEKIWLTAGLDAQQSLVRYASEAAARIPSRQTVTQAREPMMGWSSWSAYYSEIDENSILENARFVRDYLAPHGYRLVQMDDGYQTAWGDWRPNEKFPSGLKALCDEIKDMGLIPGVWIAPFLVDEGLPIIDEHPDWFMHDLEGNPIRYYQPLWNFRRALDMTHPGARQFVRDNLHGLREAGFELFKVDFLFGASYEGLHYDPSQTGISTLRSALRLVREAVGEDAWLVLVQAPWLAGAEVADFYRQSFDVVFEFFNEAWPFFEAEARGTVSRFFSHNLLFRSDPDHVLLREPTTLEETRAVVTYCALTGGMWLLSDVLPSLPAERLALATNPEILELVRAQQGARPLDLFNPSESDPFPVMDSNIAFLAELLGVERWSHTRFSRVWALPHKEDGSGVLGVFNWQDQTDDRVWTLEALGFGSVAGTCTVKDLWNAETWQVSASEGIPLVMAPHTVRLLKITPDP